MAKRVSVYLEQEILSANNIQLIHILYQSAICELRDARRNLASGQIAAKCANLTKASALIAELLAALNLDEGGEIAARLKALYEYMLSRILLANLKKQDEPISEVIGLLSTLDEGWKELAAQKPKSEQSARYSTPAARFVGAEMDAPAQVWSF